MSRVLITGSADGLGLMAGRAPRRDRALVTLHARNARAAHRPVGPARGPKPSWSVISRSIAGMRQVAEQANALRPLRRRDSQRRYRVPRTASGSRTDQTAWNTSSQINVLAPYLLTGLIPGPDRLVYLSSGMHRSGDPA